MKQLIGMEITPTSLTLAILGFFAAASMALVPMLVHSTAAATMVEAPPTIRGVGFVWRNRAKRFALSG